MNVRRPSKDGAWKPLIFLARSAGPKACSCTWMGKGTRLAERIGE